jgi:hypothetical protein
MKMGTIASPCPYDAAAYRALQSVTLRRRTILRYASRTAHGARDTGRGSLELEQAFPTPDYGVRLPRWFSRPIGVLDESAGSARKNVTSGAASRTTSTTKGSPAMG